MDSGRAEMLSWDAVAAYLGDINKVLVYGAISERRSS